jgi:hypothetical protein
LDQSRKKPYREPVLQVYGTIASLTAGSNNPKTGRDNPGNQKTG